MTILMSLLTFAKPLLSALWSALQKPAVLIALAFALLLGALWLEDHGRTAATAKAKAAEAALSSERAAEALAARQTAASTQAAATDGAKQAAIQTDLHTLTQELPHYVPVSTDTGCVFPGSVVSLLNAGAAGLQLPDTPSLTDDVPSAFRLSDLAANALQNDAAKRANDAQLVDLQAWILSQQKIWAQQAIGARQGGRS